MHERPVRLPFPERTDRKKQRNADDHALHAAVAPDFFVNSRVKHAVRDNNGDHRKDRYQNGLIRAAVRLR